MTTIDASFDAPKTKKAKYQLPSPLVSWRWRHPLAFTMQTAFMLLAVGVGAHFGKFIIVALYYIFFETWAPITKLWHEVVVSDFWRHLIRNVGEGVLGGTLGQVFGYNAYKKRIRKKMERDPNRVDRLEEWLHIPNLRSKRRITGWQLALAPLIILLYASPGFGVAGLFVLVVHHIGDGPALSAGASYWQVVVNQLWASHLDQMVVGAFASVFMARRPLLKYANDIQLYFAERRVQATPEFTPRWYDESIPGVKAVHRWILRQTSKTRRFYHTPAFRARCTDVKQRIERGEQPRSTLSHSGLVGVVMTASVFVGLGLAGFGYYVLTVIATRH